MKTSNSSKLFTVVLAATALASAGCAEKKETSQTPTAPAATTPVPMTTASNQNMDLSAEGSTASLWPTISQVPFDARADFLAGATRMETAMDEQIRVLSAKRSSMSGNVDTRSWDLAMKELETARTNFKGTIAEAKNARPENWNQVKDKIGQAWVTAQDAVSKVRSSTTS